MSTHFEANDRIKIKIDFYLKSAINRAFKSKTKRWTPKQVADLLHLEEVHHPALMEQLKAWETAGVVKVVDNSGCLFEVLKPLDDVYDKAASQK